MTKNAQLIEAIKARKGSGQFGYGITTADRYVQDAVDAVGKGMALKYFRCIGGGVDGLIKRAAQTLTICVPETETEKLVKSSSVAEMRRILGAEPPPHSMLAMVNRLTTPREDRDGDTLQTAGARLDPKAPLLWQHIHTLPIGKMVRIVEHSKDMLKVATVLLDINDLTSDAAKLFEAGALRFSHGFIAKEFEERKGKSDSGGVPRFNITLFDIVEESAVSVPSNVDAEVELFCRGGLTSDAFKSHAKSLFDARNKSMPVTADVKAAVIDGAVELTEEQVAALPPPVEMEFTKEPDADPSLARIEALEKRLAELESVKEPKVEVKLDSPVGDMTMGGPVPTTAESQAVFMERCMLDSVMMDQYPTEANRQSACTIQWGKSVTPAHKDMGECKGCGEKMMLNADGYCTDCAKSEEGDEKPGEGKPPKSAAHGTKAGRVLSRKNREKLEDALGDMDDLLKIMELPRPAKALGGSARGKVKDVVDASVITPDEPEEPSTDHVMREAIGNATADRSFRDRLRKALDMLDKADESEQLADDFRLMEQALSSPG